MIGAVIVAACAFMAQAPQQPARDTPPRASADETASISGTVVSDEAQPRKLRRVRVTLNGAAMDTGGRTLITDDEGRYRFAGLRPGQYGLTAVKDGYIPARFASGRPPRLGSLSTSPGTGLSLRSGDSVTADFRMARGAVITGVVTDTEGRPEEGAIVSAYAYQFISGAPERRLSGVSSSVRTDDRGVYRIFGLRAGEYLIGVQPGRPGDAPFLKPSTTDARAVTATIVYAPSATDVTMAARIKVAAGDERTGVDIATRYVPAATITGIASIPAGSSFASVALTRATDQPGVNNLVSSTSIQPDGAFTLSRVTPGHYTLHAIAEAPYAPSGQTGLSGGAWASGSIGIDVEGEDVSGIAIPMTATLSLSGTLIFDGASPPSVRLGSMTLPIASMGGFGVPRPFFRPIDDSHFSVSHVIPGEYRLVEANVPGIRVPMGRWWLKSVIVSGREALDGPVEIRQATDEIVVTVGEQASTVSGTARDPQGSPLLDAYVVIFGADRAAWFSNSRRVAGVRTDAQGHYTIRNLPPGEYRAGVAFDLAPGEWFDPDVLQQLFATAVPLTITGVESKTLDLLLR